MKQLYLRNIKKGFATNSSSYHSTIVLTEEEYDKWVNGDITVSNGWEEVKYEDFGEYYDTDVTRYTTPGGEKIVILCEHGHDG